MQEENTEHTFGNKDICKATPPNGKQFECLLTRKMRTWNFPAWEVRITKGPDLGCTTHVTEEQLELVEAYDPEKHYSKHSYR